MFSVRRGLIGVFAGAATAVALVILLYGGFILVRGWVEGTSEFQRKSDFINMWRELAFPYLGCGAVGAATGWAALAPHGRRRIAWTLVLVVVGSIPIMAFLSTMIGPSYRSKSGEHPLYYPSEVILVCVPPITVGLLLAWWRTLRREFASV
jgi:hypothetical protein